MRQNSKRKLSIFRFRFFGINALFKCFPRVLNLYGCEVRCGLGMRVDLISAIGRSCDIAAPNNGFALEL